MTLRLIRNHTAVDRIPCAACHRRHLYWDSEDQVHCAECSAWNGWLIGAYFVQLDDIPMGHLKGQEPLF
jgi:hypothetical protein